MNQSVIYALGAALLFGASTPLAKLLTGDLPPVLLAGLLYLGSGLGLALVRLVRDGGLKSPGVPLNEWPWLLGAIVFGGVIGPVALMFGLRSTSGATASLLLNLEAVLTASIAWVVFKENADRRIAGGMLAIVAGGVALGWQTGSSLQTSGTGPALVGLACLCWALDNNLTRKVSASDALFIAGIKGLIAGSANTALAISMGAALPPWPHCLQRWRSACWATVSASCCLCWRYAALTRPERAPTSRPRPSWGWLCPYSFSRKQGHGCFGWLLR